jgi:hypothetical protein
MRVPGSEAGFQTQITCPRSDIPDSPERLSNRRYLNTDHTLIDDFENVPRHQLRNVNVIASEH